MSHLGGDGSWRTWRSAHAAMSEQLTYPLSNATGKTQRLSFHRPASSSPDVGPTMVHRFSPKEFIGSGGSAGAGSQAGTNQVCSSGSLSDGWPSGRVEKRP